MTGISRRSFLASAPLAAAGLTTATPAHAVGSEGAGTGPDPGFVHPGGLFKRSDLDRMKYLVRTGVDPWLTSFGELSADPRASHAYSVQGDPTWTTVDREGAHNGEFESDATAAFLNALMWNITDDQRHAEKSVEIFNTWSNLTEVTGGGTEALNAGLYAWKLVEAAELIKHTSDLWEPRDLQRFKDMLVYPGYSTDAVPETVTEQNGTFYWRIYNGDPGRHGNQDMIAWRAMITMGVFLDNRIMYDRALRYITGRPHRRDDLPYVSGPSPSGPQTGENPYFASFDYLGSTGRRRDYGYNGVLEHYIWENGQIQESSRDQQHALFGVGIAAGIAEVAWNQGDDVWNSLDNRLLKGFEFTSRYNTSYVASYPDQSTPWEPSNFIQRRDRTGRWYSKSINPHFENEFVTVSRGDFAGKRPIYEQGFAHFAVRMGAHNKATWTERGRDTAISLSGYEKNGWSMDHPGWGALTFRRPPLTAGDPVTGFTEGLPSFGMNVLPGTIEAEHFDYFPIDGEGRTYHVQRSDEDGNSYRRDGVPIKPLGRDRYAVTDLEVGDWLSYTVHVPTAGDYKIEVRYSAPAGDGSIRFMVADSDVTGEVQLPATGGAGTTWSNCTVRGPVTLASGVQSMRVVIDSGTIELDSIRVSAA